LGVDLDPHSFFCVQVAGCGEDPELFNGLLIHQKRFERSRLIGTHLKHGGLGGRVFAQLGHLVNAAFYGLFQFSLLPALCFVPLSLLPCLFFLALRKR
jgi:hypothetical protein